MTAVRPGCLWLVIAAVALCAIAHPARAQVQQPAGQDASPSIPLIPAENHPWARFPAGSWTIVRLTKENYDERGVATTSVEEVKTTLKLSGPRSYTLTVERTIDVGGQRIRIAPQEQTWGLSGEKEKEQVESVDRLGESEVVLHGRRIPCEVRQAVMHGEGSKRTTVKVYFSPEVKPHALRREWTEAAASDVNAPTTIEEVVAIGLPYPVAGQLRSTAFVHTMHRLNSQTKESMEVICNDVPGGVVSQWSKELNADGKLNRRTTKELMDYQVEPPSRTIVPTRPRRIDRVRARRGDDKLSPRRDP